MRRAHGKRTAPLQRRCAVHCHGAITPAMDAARYLRRKHTFPNATRTSFGKRRRHAPFPLPPSACNSVANGARFFRNAAIACAKACVTRRYSTSVAPMAIFVDHFLRGLFQEAVPVNIDPNPVYEGSLQQVQATFGGHYRIAAASDNTGEIEMTMSVYLRIGARRVPAAIFIGSASTSSPEKGGRCRLCDFDDLARPSQARAPLLAKARCAGL